MTIFIIFREQFGMAKLQANDHLQEGDIEAVLSNITFLLVTDTHISSLYANQSITWQTDNKRPYALRNDDLATAHSTVPFQYRFYFLFFVQISPAKYKQISHFEWMVLSNYRL